MLSVNFNPIILYNKNLNRTKKVNNTQNQQQDKLNNVYYYTSGITFKSSQTKKSDKFYNAKKYLNTVNISKDTNIYNLNLEKLDGIQEGLKTFEGLNIKEIALILKNIEVITVKRGCNNHCAHCLFESDTPLKNTKYQASKASFEDFSQLISDIKQLNNRLGFNIVAPNKKYDNEDIILFFDSDSIDCYLTDANGKEYNCAELNHIQYMATGKPGTFDTHGWEPDDKKSQKRAEKIIKYFKDDKNANEIYQINISVNPFHQKMQEAIEAQKLGNPQKALQKVNEYAERMANVLFTFSPIIDKTKLSVRVANMNDKGISEEAQNFGIENQVVINKLIMEKLVKLYVNDLQYNKKYVNTKEDIIDNIKKWDFMFSKIYGATPKGRMSRFYEGFDDSKRKINDAENIQEAFLNNDDSKLKRISGLLDINGKFYIFSDPAICPTELQLNYSNKYKKTKDISLGLPKQYTLSREIINSSKITL